MEGGENDLTGKSTTMRPPGTRYQREEGRLRDEKEKLKPMKESGLLIVSQHLKSKFLPQTDFKLGLLNIRNISER